MNDNVIMNKVLDEVYSQYVNDHSFRCAVYIHPMFYNGTFSENNEYQPEEPETLLTKEEFVGKLENNEDYKWSMGVQVLYVYLSRQKNKE